MRDERLSQRDDTGAPALWTETLPTLMIKLGAILGPLSRVDLSSRETRASLDRAEELSELN